MQTYTTKNTCSRQIIYDVTDDKKLTNVKFIGGCSGNLQAVSKLIEGMHINDVIKTCKGILCRANTSCADQLAQALIEYKKRNNIE